MLIPTDTLDVQSLSGLTHSRVCTPGETLNRFEPLAESLGITRLADVTGLDRIGIPVFMACRPNSRSLAVFQGKGPTTEAARVSALMEAIETFHAENIDAGLLLTTYSELSATRRAVDVMLLPQSIDGIFAPDAKRLWIEGCDLLSQQKTWVPYAAVHCDYTTELDAADACFLISTNGLASGNTLTEAMSHGVFEVIERDATTLWNLQSDDHKAATELNLDSIHDATPRAMIEQCLAADIALRVWDATSNIGVPVYIAELYETGEALGATWSRPAWGSGCHHAKDVALVRAVSEAVQARTTFIAGARDDMSWADYCDDHQARPIGSAGHTTGAIDYSVRQRYESRGVDVGLSESLEKLTMAGFRQVIAVDLSKDDVGVPVARLIVPGLEGPDDDFLRYVPGARARALSGWKNP